MAGRYCDESGCYPPRNEQGLVQGGTCETDLDDGVHHIWSPCDDGEGYCPSEHCRYYGPCICDCHR